MYNGFMNGLARIGDVINSANLLLILTFSVLGAIFVFNVVMIIVSLRFKRRFASQVRKAVAVAVAWLWFAFALLNTGILAVPFALLSLYIVAIPFTFLLLFYVFEVLFRMFDRLNCQCSCGEACERTPNKKQKPVKKQPVLAECSDPFAEVTEKPNRVSKPVLAVAPEPKQVRTPEKKREPKVVETTVVEEYEEVEPKVKKVVVKETKTVTKSTPEPAPVGGRALLRAEPAPMPAIPIRKESIKGKARTLAVQPSKVKSSVKKPDKKADDFDKQDRIEALGAKIERQRQKAERTADSDRYSNYSSAPLGEAPAKIERTAAQMDDLQRRMDALRKTVNEEPHVRTGYSVVEHTVTSQPKSTTTTTSTSVRSHRDESLVRTVAELRREQDDMKRQYESLQSRLTEIRSEHTGGSQNATKVGYYDASANFERTGRSEYLSKIPNQNKFDEDEVKAALLGLRNAMNDLQKQIDNSDHAHG